jgi:hypothetical protein
MDESFDKLKETLAICELHNTRMNFAWGHIKHHFPLTEQSFGAIPALEMALFDQLIYRFSKLQDAMGSKLFVLILEALQEEINGIPFIDILNKLEKLHLINSAKSWIAMRQIRNNISHEYPIYKEIQIQELNLLPNELKKLTTLWDNLNQYCNSKFNL